MDLTSDSLIKSLLAVVLVGLLTGLALLVASFGERRSFWETGAASDGPSGCALAIAYCPRR